MNLKKIATVALTSGAAVTLVAAPATAAVTYDTATGGFAGKGDVQLALELNNKALQDIVNANANAINFQYEAVVVSEVTWVCTNPRNENTQERERTTTSTVTGVVSGVARDGKKQFTGFNLAALAAGSSSGSSTEGPAVNSCPNNFALTSPAGAPVELSNTGGLQVRNGTGGWIAIG